jgi:hypothetical protein
LLFILYGERNNYLYQVRVNSAMTVENYKRILHQSTDWHNDFLANHLMKGEYAQYHSEEIYITNRRILQCQTSTWSRLFHYSHDTFKDLDLQALETITAKNTINKGLLLIGFCTLLLGPIGWLLSAIPGISPLGGYLSYLADALGLGGLLTIGLIIIASALIIRDRIIEFKGAGNTLVAKHLNDDELVKVRQMQQLCRKH